MDNFMISLNAIIPFLIYLAFGNISRRCGVFDEAFANKLNKVMFRLFFPCLTFCNMYNASWETMPSSHLYGGGWWAACWLDRPAVRAHAPLCAGPQPGRRWWCSHLPQQHPVYGLPLTLHIFGDEAGAWRPSG